MYTHSAQVRNFTIPKSQKPYSLVISILLHTVVALLILIKFNTNTSFTPQSIKVNFVAPSTIKSSKMHKKKLENNGLKPSINSADANDINKTDSNINNVTSGEERKDATEKTSSITNSASNIKYLDNPSPIYPVEARRNGITGKVFLLVHITNTGTTKDIEISKSSEYAILDEAAKTAVTNWKFIPMQQNGVNIPTSVIIPIEFKQQL